MIAAMSETPLCHICFHSMTHAENFAGFLCMRCKKGVLYGVRHDCPQLREEASFDIQTDPADGRPLPPELNFLAGKP